jgi:hypothetical protein
MATAESNIQNASLIAVGTRDDVLAMRLHSGMFRSMHDDRIIRVGQKGMADSMMIVSVEITPEMVGKTVGIALAAEFKTNKGKQSDDQKRWQSAIEKRGGFYRLIRSASEMIKFIDDIKKDLQK